MFDIQNCKALKSEGFGIGKKVRISLEIQRSKASPFLYREANHGHDPRSTRYIKPILTNLYYHKTREHDLLSDNIIIRANIRAIQFLTVD